MPNRPHDDDPAGTPYVRDSDGKIIIDRRAQRHRLRDVLVGLFLVLLTVIAVGTIVNAVHQSHQQDTLETNQERIDHDQKLALYNFREAQRGGCDSGNGLRAGLRALIQDQIDSAEATDPALFPQIPEDEFLRLIKQRVKELRKLSDKNFHALNCEARYPHLDNPDTDVNEAGT